MASGVQTLLQKYGVPLLVSIALTGGVGIIEAHDAAVARRALVRAYTDSIVAVHVADSTAAAQRESTYAVALQQSAAARKVALQHAAVTEVRADSLEAVLADSGTTLPDSVALLVSIHTQDSSTIADLHRAIVRFQADSVVRDQREQDLHSQLAAANHTIATLIIRVNQDAKQGILNSTPVKVGEAVLAGYGAVKLGQATHLLP